MYASRSSTARCSSSSCAVVAASGTCSKRVTRTRRRSRAAVRARHRGSLPGLRKLLRQLRDGGAERVFELASLGGETALRAHRLGGAREAGRRSRV
jgi:hypothetical protein